MQAKQPPPKLSIITINLNNKAGLEKTIQSVVQQTFKDFEYIVIDGASTDGSVEVIQQYAEQIEYWVSEPDKGIYNAMNKGISASKGDYILFLNSGDSLFEIYTLEKASSYLDNSTSILSCDLLVEIANEEILIEAPEQIEFQQLFFSYLSHPSSFIKKSLFNQYGSYNEDNKIVSDWEFFLLTLGLNDEGYKKIPLVCTLFNSNGISSNQANSQLIIDEKLKARQRLLSFRLTEHLELCELNRKKLNSRRFRLLAKIEQNPFWRRLITFILKVISKIISR